LFTNTNFSDLEKQILEILQREPLTIDELVHTTNQSPALINQTVSLLGLKGFITDSAGRLYLKDS
jgi:predicted Rossmann fold nucleotide-binding protein DprA/Smf involved in DNA uptake